MTGKNKIFKSHSNNMIFNSTHPYKYIYVRYDQADLDEQYIVPIYTKTRRKLKVYDIQVRLFIHIYTLTSTY